MTRRIAMCLLILVACGCGNDPSKDQPLSLEQVPENILKAAEQERARSLPDVKFERAARHADGSYEVRGKGKNGKVRDIELDANGKLIEIE
jgi:hypothetical protein